MWIIIILVLCVVVALLRRGAKVNTLYTAAVAASIENYVTSANQYIMTKWINKDFESEYRQKMAAGEISRRDIPAYTFMQTWSGRAMIGYLIDIAYSANCILHRNSFYPLDKMRSRDIKNIMMAFQNSNDLIVLAFNDFKALLENSEQELASLYEEDLTQDNFTKAINILEESI